MADPLVRGSRGSISSQLSGRPPSDLPVTVDRIVADQPDSSEAAPRDPPVDQPASTETMLGSTAIDQPTSSKSPPKDTDTEQPRGSIQLAAEVGSSDPGPAVVIKSEPAEIPIEHSQVSIGVTPSNDAILTSSPSRVRVSVDKQTARYRPLPSDHTKLPDLDDYDTIDPDVIQTLTRKFKSTVDNKTSTIPKKVASLDRRGSGIRAKKDPAPPLPRTPSTLAPLTHEEARKALNRLYSSRRKPSTHSYQYPGTFSGNHLEIINHRAVNFILMVMVLNSVDFETKSFNYPDWFPDQTKLLIKGSYNCSSPLDRWSLTAP